MPVCVLAEQRQHQRIVLVFLTELLELCLIHRNVQLQDLRVCMELFSIHRVPGIHCGGVVCSDLLDLRQHGPVGLAALLLRFCTAFVRMDPRDGFALLYLPKLGIYESTTKTEDAAYIHLPPETLQLLREYRARYNELKLKKGMKKADCFRSAI